MTNEELLAAALAPESDTLAGDDLLTGPRTILITNVEVKRGAERPLIINFEGDEKRPWKPCKTTGRSLVALWGGDFMAWVGRSVQLERDADVIYGGQKVGGVRIKAVSHIDRETTVSERLNGKQIKARKVQPLTAKPKQDNTAAAEKAGRAFITNIARAPSPEKLDEYAASKAGLLADLARDLPEVHAEAIKSLEEKRASFSVQDAEDDPFAETEEETV